MILLLLLSLFLYSLIDLRQTRFLSQDNLLKFLQRRLGILAYVFFDVHLQTLICENLVVLIHSEHHLLILP